MRINRYYISTRHDIERPGVRVNMRCISTNMSFTNPVFQRDNNLNLILIMVVMSPFLFLTYCARFLIVGLYPPPAYSPKSFSLSSFATQAASSMVSYTPKWFCTPFFFIWTLHLSPNRYTLRTPEDLLLI